MKQDETFLSLPYDPIYYYFIGQESPISHLILFKTINITEQQERNFIVLMKQKRTNWIILSNAAHSQDPAEGILGEDYGLLMSKYINDYYTTVIEFNDWNIPFGWAWNHSVRILKKNEKEN